MQKIGYGAGLLVGLVILVILQWPSQNLRVIACDVGQGDAILVIKAETQILVDGGPSESKILACLEKHLPFWDRHIELIVMTNTDYDHMNGLIPVLERYRVRQFVTSDGVRDSAALDKLRGALGANGVTVSAVGQGDRIRILGPETIELKVLWPPEVIEEYVAVLTRQIEDEQREQILGASAKRGDLNERSVVVEILEDNKRYLLMGDAGFQAEASLINTGWLQEVDYLKVGHHGSKYASSQEFLAVIKPKIAVISVGKNNRYGHPTSEALARLEQVGARIRRTDVEGEVVVELD